MTSTSEMERPHQPVIWPPGGMLSDWQARADLSQFFPYGSLGWLEFPFFLLPLCLDWVLYSTSANSMVFPPPSSFQNSASRLGSNLGLCSSTHRRCPLFLSGWFSARCIISCQFSSHLFYQSACLQDLRWASLNLNSAAASHAYIDILTVWYVMCNLRVNICN